MKHFLLSALLLPLFCHAQQYALIDKTLKAPILFSDTVTQELVNQGFFPIPMQSADTLIASLNYVKEMLSVSKRTRVQPYELRCAQTVIEAGPVFLTNEFRYNIVAKTKTGRTESVFTLANTAKSNARNASWVNDLLAYLKSNKYFFKSDKMIHPTVYFRQP